MNNKPLNPLGKLALSFSGGGFRAAAFCLGNLSYLNYRTIISDKDKQETLLSRVEFISSASGGSFPNLAYAYFLYSDEPFAECYQSLRHFMDGTELLDVVFKTLNDDKIWEKYPNKGRNLINAFAIAYDETLFHGANLGLLNNADRMKSLREICANATEFEDGISFRFQNSDGFTRNGKVGNGNLYLNTNYLNIIGEIRLADIIAASSCFPAGFEPMIFPDDFSHENLSVSQLASTIYTRNPNPEKHIGEEKDLLKDALNKSQVNVKELDKHGFSNPTLKFALMDGGIDDNQGIQSMMLADARSEGNDKFDTLIVCDVASPFMTPYVPTQENKRGIIGKYSLTFWGIFYFIFFGLLVGLGLSIAKDWNWKGIDWSTVFVSIGMVGLLIGGGIYWYLKTKYSEIAKGSWGKIVDKYIGYFLKIRISVLEQMIATRAESMVKMTTDIFLKQIRRMAYQLFYAKKEWEYRRITVTIYELSTTGYSDTEQRIKQKLPNFWQKIPPPSQKVMDIAQQARDMGTTLWFDENDQKLGKRDKIIATGQFTMCFNLLVYLFEIEECIPLVLSPSLKELQKELLNDWTKFNQNPNWLL